MSARWSGFELGVAQANATAAPVAALVVLAAGHWVNALIFAADGIAGLMLWHRLGWKLRP